MLQVQPDGSRSSFPRYAGLRYFSAEYIDFYYCAGTETNPEHYKLLPPGSWKSSFWLPPPTKDCHNIARYFQTLFTIRPNSRARTTADSLPNCYRHKGSTSALFCDGLCHKVTAYISLPYMLQVEMGDVPASDAMYVWHAPKTFVPIKDLSSSVFYEYVGTGFHKPGHWTAQFSPDGKSLYYYDDVVSSSATCIASTLTETHVNTGIPGTASQRAHTLLYRLVGGEEAQDSVREHQTSTLYLHHQIALKISSKALDSSELEARLLNPLARFLPVEQREWLDITNTTSLEYNLQPQPVLPLHAAPEVVVSKTRQSYPILEKKRWPKRIFWQRDIFPRLLGSTSFLDPIVDNPTALPFCQELMEKARTQEKRKKLLALDNVYALHHIHSG